MSLEHGEKSEVHEQAQSLKSRAPPLTAMLGGVFLETFSGLASEGFDDLIGERWKMVLELSSRVYEGRNVIGLATCSQLSVLHDLAVVQAPTSICVVDISF